MNNFLKLILMGKGMMIKANIGRNTTRYESNGMIMDSTGRGKFVGCVKNNLVAGEDGLEVVMQRGCLNKLNGVDLDNNGRMTIF
jgi:hypothetical protein